MSHLAPIALVIVTQKVQQPMKREHAELRAERVSHPAGLAPRRVEADRDVAEVTVAARPTS